MVAIMLGADNGLFFAGQVVYFSSPFTVFLIYHKQHIVYRVFPFTAANTDNKSVIDNTTPYLSSRSRCCRRYRV